MALLEEGLVKLGVSPGAGGGILPLLTRYIEEIELFNPAYGLVKVQDREELIVKHILDSLAPLGIIRNLLTPAARQVADVGSGAGLPGIPLAVCMPQAAFTLIERMGRRAGFLRDAVAVLGLPNVRVEEADMDALRSSAGNPAGTPSVAPPFDLIVFRAFKPLDGALLKKLLSLLKPGGTLAAYKGRRQSIEEEMSRLAALPSGAWEILPLEVPFLEEDRHLVLIRGK